MDGENTSGTVKSGLDIDIFGNVPVRYPRIATDSIRLAVDGLQCSSAGSGPRHNMEALQGLNEGSPESASLDGDILSLRISDANQFAISPEKRDILRRNGSVDKEGAFGFLLCRQIIQPCGR
jgi:hypothetical protein